MKNSLLTLKIKCVLFDLDVLIHQEKVKDVLTSLPLPYSVVSAESTANTEFALRTTELLGFFDNDKIFSSLEYVSRPVLLSTGKPDSSILSKALRSMGFIPSECVFVGQTNSNIDIAVQEGFWVFVINSSTNDKSDKDDYTTNNFTDRGSYNHGINSSDINEFENKDVLVFNKFDDLIELIEVFNKEADLEITAR